MTRRRKKSAEPDTITDTITGPLSEREELALAIVLWKSLRCHGALSEIKSGKGKGAPTHESVDLGEKAIAMAKRAGVKDEFFALLFRLRLVKVTLTPME